MMKKVIKIIKDNKYVKFAIKVFLNLTSVFIFLSIIFLISLYVIFNYRLILNQFGIFIEDDCNLSKNQFYCNYIKITDKKEFDVNLEKVSGTFNLRSLFNIGPILDLNIENLKGTYTNDLKAPPSKKIDGIFYTYLIANYVSANIKNGEFLIKNIEENADLNINNISLYNIDNDIYFKNEVSIDYLKSGKTYNFIIKNQSNNPALTVYQNKLITKNISITTSYLKPENPILLIKQLILNDDKTFKIDTNLKASNLVYESFNLSNLNADLNIEKKKDIRISFNGDIVKILREGINIANQKLDGELELIEKDKKTFLKGKLKSSINNLVADNISFGELNIDLKFDYDKSQKITGRLSSNFANGSIDFNEKRLILDLNTSSIKNVLSLLKHKDEILSSIDGSANLKIDYPLDSEILKFEIKSNYPTFLGFKYESLSGSGNVDLKNYSVSFSGNSFSKTSKLDFSGSVNQFNSENLNFKVGLSFDNTVLENLMFLKDIPIKGIANGNGVISGNLKSIEINLNGLAKSFSYEEINLKNVNYSLKFKDKNLTVNGSYQSSLNYVVNADLNKNKTDINLVLKDFNLSPVYPFLKKRVEILNRFNVYKSSGNANISIENKQWNVKLDLQDIKAQEKEFNIPLNIKLSGIITEKLKDLKITAGANKFNFKDYFIDDLNLDLKLLNDRLSYSLKINSSNLNEKFKDFSLLADGLYSISENKINGNLSSSLNIPNGKLSLNGRLSGRLDKYDGSLKISILKDGKETVINPKISGDKDKLVANIDGLNYETNKRIKLITGDGILIVNFNKDDFSKSSGTIEIKDFEIKENELSLIKLKGLKGIVKDKSIQFLDLYFEGIAKGYINKLIYNLDNEMLDVSVKGELDKRYISQFLKYVILDGKVSFVYGYNGKIDKILEDSELNLIGNNMTLKTPYISNIVSIDKFSIKMKDLLYIDVKGNTRSSFGDSYIQINGNINPDTKIGAVKITSQVLPVKYQNIFNGVLNTNTDVKIEKDKILINSLNQTTGKIKIEPEFFTKESKEEKPEFLKNINLNVKINTFSPIFVEGGWGKVYTEGKLDITGTAYNPVVNGNIRINYGKVDFLKVKYKVDYIDLKIIDNKAYVNGRLSTQVSGTYIYVNLSGAAENIKYDFFSTPPKSKDEILTLLLIKQTPEQLASSGLFNILGSVAKILSPFKEESEESGLFGTGFNVNVIPSYNPTQGITFNVYVQKYLTRKIYLGLSRPVGNTLNTFGWYEGGYRFTERSSFVIKFYENNTRSGEITFTLPFDF